MPILANAFTSQKPLTALGLTGKQILKLIPAPRVFIKAVPDSQTAATVPTVKAAGLTPAGWSDLGVVDGNLKVGYLKKVKEIRTGIDNYLRAAYTNEKSGQLEFQLTQVDDTVLGLITGLTASVTTAGSIYTYHLGQEDLNQVALLLVVDSKLDGKEWQWYSPLVYLNFEFVQSGDALVLKANAILPAFTVVGQATEDFLAATIFA
jgi:hypothetical protein